MSRRVIRARSATAVAAAALVLAVPAATASAGGQPSRPPRPAGRAWAARSAYPVAADVVRFSFDVRATAVADGPVPVAARGTLGIRHYVSADGVTYRWDLAADCLLTGGRVAVVTGTVSDTSSPELAAFYGQRIGFTVVDGAPDQLGTTGPHPVTELPPCLTAATSRGPVSAPAPLDQVVSGDYRIRDGRP